LRSEDEGSLAKNLFLPLNFPFNFPLENKAYFMPTQMGNKEKNSRHSYPTTSKLSYRTVFSIMVSLYNPFLYNNININIDNTSTPCLFTCGTPCMTVET
jgi:hypothetical protein